jgi:F-type H+-transporting ATPase subunit b
MPQLDPTTFAPQLIWLAITFVALYALMAWVALPKVGKVIDERRARIETDLKEAQRLRTESEAIHAAYERSLSEARAEAQAAIRQTMDRVNAEAAERQREAAARLASETAAAETRIAAARTAALANVRTIAVEVARAAAGHLTGTVPDEARVGVAVDAVMKERA